MPPKPKRKRGGPLIDMGDSPPPTPSVPVAEVPQHISYEPSGEETILTSNFNSPGLPSLVSMDTISFTMNSTSYTNDDDDPLPEFDAEEEPLEDSQRYTLEHQMEMMGLGDCIAGDDKADKSSTNRNKRRRTQAVSVTSNGWNQPQFSTG